jgi:hypothetical protein
MRRESRVCGSRRLLRARGKGVLAGATAMLLALAGAAVAEDAFQCGLKESEGVSETDARTAAALVCGQLRRESGGRGEYEVSLAALGKAVFVTVARREPEGSVTARVDAVEEVPTAAERLARALVRGESFASTQRVGNLLESETQPALAKKGSIKFLVGVADVESPGFGARAAGFSIGMVYATPRFALPAEMRFAWDDARYPKPELSLFSLSVGGRAYLSTRDTSPFLGGGLGVLRLHAREGDYPGHGLATSEYFDAERFGVAPYVEVGVEALRLHRARIALQVRADFPTGALETPEIPIYAYRPDGQGDPVLESTYPARSRYVVPVSIGVSVAF